MRAHDQLHDGAAAAANQALDVVQLQSADVMAVDRENLVARLDAAEINARLEQAEASLEQAERDWKRISTLFEQQAVTRAARRASR